MFLLLVLGGETTVFRMKVSNRKYENSSARRVLRIAKTTKSHRRIPVSLPAQNPNIPVFPHSGYVTSGPNLVWDRLCWQNSLLGLHIGRWSGYMLMWYVGWANVWVVVTLSLPPSEIETFLLRHLVNYVGSESRFKSLRASLTQLCIRFTVHLA